MIPKYIAPYIILKCVSWFQIDLDFAYMYPKKEMNLFNKFEIFKHKLKMFLNKNSINIGIQGSQLLTKLNEPINNDKCITFT